MDSSSLQIFAENCKEEVSCGEMRLALIVWVIWVIFLVFSSPGWNWMFHDHWDLMWDTGEHLQLWVKAP
jgi:hypothetical protein